MITVFQGLPSRYLQSQAQEALPRFPLRLPHVYHVRMTQGPFSSGLPRQHIYLRVKWNCKKPHGAPEGRVLSSLGRLTSSGIWHSQPCLPRKATVLHQETLTSIKASSCGRPAHDRWDGSNHGSNPGVGDADPLQRCVTTGIEENVEDAQSPCEGIHSPGQKGHSWHSTAGSKRHS